MTDAQIAEFAALCVMNRRSEKTAKEMLAEYKAERGLLGHYERQATDPKLKRTRVSVTYRASDGRIAEFSARAGTGSKHLLTGDEVPPEEALLAGVEELARLCELFGFGAEASKRVTDAQARVREHMANRNAQAVGVPSWTPPNDCPAHCALRAKPLRTTSPSTTAPPWPNSR